MKIWLPVAVGGLIVAAYFIFYMISATESSGSTSLGLANAVGLFAVLVGLFGAGLILRRGAPPAETRESSNA
ncbi:MAG: hypothetical protein JRM80_06390 [Nitrososphaerota archaeon]|nr:hypothetical protein [Nitrososphaerota archaeon]